MKTISFKGLLAKPLPPIKYLVDKIIPKAQLIYLYGPPGSFKTNIMLYISLLGLRGDDIFEYTVKRPFRTLWIDEENRAIGMKEKLRKLQNSLKLNPKDLEKNNFVICHGINILKKSDIGEIEELIKKLKPELLVVDSVAKVFLADERDEAHVKIIFQMLNPLIIKYNITIVLIHHTRKLQHGQTKRGMEDLSGSREFSAHADGMLFLGQYERNGFRLEQTKNRYSELCEPINFEVVSDDNSMEVRYLGLASDNIEAHKASTKVQHYILGLMEPGKEYSFMDIKSGCDPPFKRTSIYEGLTKLVENGKVDKPRRDCYLLPNLTY